MPSAPAPTDSGSGDEGDDGGDDDDGSGGDGDDDPGMGPSDPSDPVAGQGVNGSPATPGSIYAHRAVSYIDTFFLNPATYMNPSLQYGQLIRGPRSSSSSGGQFMGIVDARGLVQIWNMVAVLRTMRAKEWTAEKDKALMIWAGAYMNWLTTSDLGMKAAMSAKYVIPTLCLPRLVTDTKPFSHPF